MNIKTAIKALKKQSDKLAKDRDALRDLESEISDILASCERGKDALDESIDALSELV